MKLLRNISFPFVPVYYTATWIRNKLYDLNIMKSKSYNIPVICVGNLSVGGTGKSPMIEYLIRLLNDSYNIATLSRGYKRKTTGFQLANENSTSETIGDEPFQFYYKFKDNITVAVDSDRREGIEKLQARTNSPEVILLDDAFQHRKVKAGLNILLTTYDHLYVNDYVLPTGNLREPKQNADRAQIIVITKCPDDLNEAKKNDIVSQLKPKSHQHVFFSSILYSEEVISNKGNLNINELPEFTLMTGIANAEPLVNFLNSKKLKFEHLHFKDHHEFSKNEISLLSKKDNMVITTEKDYMRLKHHKSLQDFLYYLPIELHIHNDHTFNTLVTNFINQY